MKWGLSKRNNSESALSNIQRDISHIFDDFFTIRPSLLGEFDWTPTIDVRENDKNITVNAEIPGINEKDINVTLQNNILTISGEKNETREEKDVKDGYVLSERKFGSFCRSISLPEGIKDDKIKAEFKNGVLKIEIPKDETVKQKRITINVN